MAYIAYTRYVVEGSIESLSKIKAAIESAPDKSGVQNTESNVLSALGIECGNKNVGGYIVGGIELSTILRFDAREVWAPTDFDELLMQNFPDIKVYWCTEEPDFDNFVTNDRNGKYFPERFYVDYDIDGNKSFEKFSTKEELFNHLSEVTGGKVTDEESRITFNLNLENGDYIVIYNVMIL